MRSYLEQCPILLEAYEHFKSTNDRQYKTFPKNKSHLVNILNSVQALREDGYITNLSDNLIGNSTSIFPPDMVSFEITPAGVEYVERNRKS